MLHFPLPSSQEHHQETGLYGAYVGSYVGFEKELSKHCVRTSSSNQPLSQARAVMDAVAVAVTVTTVAVASGSGKGEGHGGGKGGGGCGGNNDGGSSNGSCGGSGSTRLWS